jgi:hypothetical protein
MRALPRCGLITTALLFGLAVAGAQEGEKGKGLASPQQQGDQEKAQHTKPGQAGTTEPSAQAKTAKPEDTAAFVNGRLAAPGAPADSQTVPAKFSKRNATLDELPTMAFPTALTPEQKQRILAAVKASNAPVAQVQLHPADQLPPSVEMRALPDKVTAEIPVLRNHGFVRTADGLLLVIPASRIVVVEVRN